MARDPTSWTAEERRELRKFIACHCWKHRDGREATPEEMEALALRCEVSGPPPREDPATTATVRAMGRAARKWLDEIERNAR